MATTVPPVATLPSPGVNLMGEKTGADNLDFYSSLAENVSDILSRHTPEGVYLYVSAACRSWLGYTPEELVGRSIHDFCHPEDLAIIEKLGSPTPGTSNSVVFSYRMRSQDGRYLWFETSSKPLYSPETGQLKEIVAVSREITERKQSELELKQRNQELTVLQSAGVVITSSLDLRYVLDTVTREMTRLLDVESCTIAEWQVDKNNLARLAKYGAEGWWDPSVLPKVHRLENYPLTKWVLEEQIPTQMTLSQASLDPAERAYMQANNIQTRFILPMIYHQTTVGLVELEDSRTERTFAYQEIYIARLMANQAASAMENARLYERAKQEIGERQRAEAALMEERALLARRVEERTADLSRANAELARAARLKDEFLANVSHELRTPLNAILGSAEILQTGTFGPVNEKQIKYLRNVEESGGHLLSVINDILDLSKAEAGKLDLDIRPVSIEAVCQASLRLIRQLATKKGLQVAQNFNELGKVTLLADELRLKQILVNLLSNAVKFTPEGGQVGLEVTGDAARQVIRFTVWDTGIGIAPKNMGQLFRPFIQLESKLSRQYGGTGLGLSLVARMAELHGGSVAVDSDGVPGQGSRFTVSLPWREPTREPRHAGGSKTGLDHRPEDRVRRRQRETQPLILLAEDNESSIETIQDYLENQGYRLIVARHGEEVLERCRETKPDLILMDIQMPRMDGLEATRHLRLNPTMDSVPIIAITALAMPGDRQRCLEAGATDYLSKPLHFKGLLEMIESYFNLSESREDSP